MIKRESLWRSTGFVCLLAFRCSLPWPGRAHPRPRLSPPPALPRSQERKVWQVPDKGRGERPAPLPAPRRAAPRPPGRPAFRFPAAKSRLPSCVPARRKAPRGKERAKRAGCASEAAARSAPGPAAASAPRRAPGSAPPEATSGQKRPRRPPLGPARPPASGRAGKRGRSGRLRAAVPPKEAEAVTPLPLSYFPSLSTDLEKYARVIYLAAFVFVLGWLRW